MKISIVTPVLNSHEVVRRQLLYMDKFLQDDTEVIIVDDGSEPALKNTSTNPNVTILYTNDHRPWTWALALNKGIRHAKGEFIVIIGIDHFVSPALLDCVRNFPSERLGFVREFGVITEQGEFTQNKEVLAEYGLNRKKLRKGVKLGTHNGIFAIRKDVWDKLGGYREDLVDRPYPQGEERDFKKVWGRYAADKDFPTVDRPTVYMFPCGYHCNGDVDYDKFGLFHKLSRKSKKNRRHKEGDNGGL